MRRPRIWALIAAALALTACSAATSTPAQPVEVTLEAKEFAFSPAAIEVMAGQPVRLTLHNMGTLDHDFSIAAIPMAMPPAIENGGMDMDHSGDLPEMHVATMMGQSNTVEFTPTEPGAYEFFCTVAGHKEAGMVGQLVVTAP